MEDYIGAGARTILLVKTSSLGDIVHNLPVVEDIRRAVPVAAIDWVVEGTYASIPGLHSGIRRVIPCELRLWRRSWLRRSTRREWHSFVALLRSERYDCIIDTQGLLKSAIIARAAIGHRVGLDWKSSREPLWPLYDRVVNVPWDVHAVERNRQLAGAALHYTPSGDPQYGIRAERSSAEWLPKKPYVVFLHGASAASKLWPRSYWIELGRALCSRELSIVLPWGTEAEGEAARQIASALPEACVAPRISLGELAGVIAGSHAAVGVDTGLTHLAAALGIPSVGIFGATDPAATGIHARGSAVNVGMAGTFPSVRAVLAAFETLLGRENLSAP